MYIGHRIFLYFMHFVVGNCTAVDKSCNCQSVQQITLGDLSDVTISGGNISDYVNESLIAIGNHDRESVQALCKRKLYPKSIAII